MQGLSGWFAKTRSSTASIHEVFELHDQCILGRGSFGKVVKGRRKVDGQPVAIKHMCFKEETRSSAVERQMSLEEIDITKGLAHENIIKLYDHFAESANIYLIMELCEGGKLIPFLANTRDYTESDASCLISQLLEAMSYLHTAYIVHRDIKPDNMLLASLRPVKSNTLKLIDFGLSSRRGSIDRAVRLKHGTPDFMSPEALDFASDSKTDIWSCGVTMYNLLCGYTPFRAETVKGVEALVRRGNFTFPDSEWRIITSDAKDMLRWLLAMDPRNRCTAEEALGHRWIASRLVREPLLRTLDNFRRAKNQKNQQHESDPFTAFLAGITEWWQRNSQDFHCGILDDHKDVKVEVDHLVVGPL